MSAPGGEDARVRRLVLEARAAHEQAQALLDEARRAPFAPGSLEKLREARAMVLRAAALLEEAGAAP